MKTHHGLVLAGTLTGTTAGGLIIGATPALGETPHLVVTGGAQALIVVAWLLLGLTMVLMGIAVLLKPSENVIRPVRFVNVEPAHPTLVNTAPVTRTDVLGKVSAAASALRELTDLNEALGGEVNIYAARRVLEETADSLRRSR